MARLSHLTMPTAEQAFRPYKELVENYDMAFPMMLWATRDAVQPVQVMPPADWPEEASLTDLYIYAANGLLEQLGQPVWVVVSAEAFMVDVNSWEEVEAYRHGDAEKRREAGDTSVKDAVTITGVSLTQDYSFQIPFERQKHRVRWGKAKQGQASGAIADLLKQLVR